MDKIYLIRHQSGEREIERELDNLGKVYNGKVTIDRVQNKNVEKRKVHTRITSLENTTLASKCFDYQFSAILYEKGQGIPSGGDKGGGRKEKGLLM